ncbi:hypothetical protein [Enterococcus faecalis]|uniref:hypothetical protein n=1 Tax=Enterococcus faecalis TaxID=1351 RepID=UPI003D0C00AE
MRIKALIMISIVFFSALSIPASAVFAEASNENIGTEQGLHDKIKETYDNKVKMPNEYLGPKSTEVSSLVQVGAGITTIDAYASQVLSMNLIEKTDDKDFNETIDRLNENLTESKSIAKLWLSSKEKHLKILEDIQAYSTKFKRYTDRLIEYARENAQAKEEGDKITIDSNKSKILAIIKNLRDVDIKTQITNVSDASLGITNLRNRAIQTSQKYKSISSELDKIVVKKKLDKTDIASKIEMARASINAGQELNRKALALLYTAGVVGFGGAFIGITVMFLNPIVGSFIIAISGVAGIALYAISLELNKKGNALVADGSKDLAQLLENQNKIDKILILSKNLLEQCNSLTTCADSSSRALEEYRNGWVSLSLKYSTLLDNVESDMFTAEEWELLSMDFETAQDNWKSLADLASSIQKNIASV